VGGGTGIFGAGHRHLGTFGRGKIGLKGEKIIGGAIMDMDWIKTAMEEYKTLREESLTSLTRQLQILSIGGATIGVILLAAINGWEKVPFPKTVFMYVIPGVLLLIFIIWLTEVFRMRRAGRYLVNLENKINFKFRGMGKDDPLTWENFLTKKSFIKRFYLYYIAIFLIITTMAIGSFYFGYYKIKPTEKFKLFPSYSILVNNS
jgi:hypothetical protein